MDPATDEGDFFYLMITGIAVIIDLLIIRDMSSFEDMSLITRQDTAISLKKTNIYCNLIIIVVAIQRLFD